MSFKNPTNFTDLIKALERLVPEIRDAFNTLCDKYPKISLLQPANIEDEILNLIEEMKHVNDANSAQDNLKKFILILDLSNIHSYYLGIIDFYIDLYVNFVNDFNSSRNQISHEKDITINSPVFLNSSWYQRRLKEDPRNSYFRSVNLQVAIENELNIGNLKKEQDTTGNELCDRNFKNPTTRILDFRYAERTSFNLNNISTSVKSDSDLLGETSVEIDDNNKEINITMSNWDEFVDSLYSCDVKYVLALLLEHPELISRVNERWIFKDENGVVQQSSENMLMYCREQGSFEACMILMLCGANPACEVTPTEYYLNCKTPQEYFAHRPKYLLTSCHKISDSIYNILKNNVSRSVDELKNNLQNFEVAMKASRCPLVFGYRSDIINSIYNF